MAVDSALMRKAISAGLYFVVFEFVDAFVPTSNPRKQFVPLTTKSSTASQVVGIIGHQQRTKGTALSVAWNYNAGGAEDHNLARTCVRNFLTQRAIQSFCFLCEECRDPHTVKWIEDFTSAGNLLEFHGTGAFNMTRFSQWDTVLREIMTQPNEVMVVSARRRGRGRGGWSKNNPYLEDRFVEFNIDINPPSITCRILSVREQIAKEWEQDLATVIATNDLIMESYIQNLRLDGSEGMTGGGLDNTGCKVVFDRNAMRTLLDRTAFEDVKSSPFRKGSFDLLLLLSMHESIHRVLRELRKRGSKQELHYEWLATYYTERIPAYFDGSQRYGRGDDFLEELLNTPPLFKQLEKGKTGIVNTIWLAEQIIQMRSVVAQDWIEELAKIPEEHMELKTALWDAQMAAWGQPAETPSVEVNTGSFE